MYEILFHQRALDQDSDNILDKYRLDPTVASNMKTWLLLRIRYLEDCKLEQDIQVSIALMNRAVVVCFIFFGWLFYVYLLDMDFTELEEESHPSIMTWLGLAYILNIMGPMIYSLSAAVSTMDIA
jgi:hypothetical protein